MTIESNRTLGGVGAILTLFGAFSSISSFVYYFFPKSTVISLINLGVGGIFGVIAFVGFLLYIIAMYGFSKDYSEPKIFSYILYGIIITIIAAVIVVVIAVLIILFNFASLFPNFNFSTSSSQIASSFSKTFGSISPFFSLIGVIWIIFNVRAFNLLADKSKVPMFRTGAKVLLAGALVNIGIAVISSVIGFYVSVSFSTLLALLSIVNLVQDIAWLLLAIAYFRIQAAPNIPMQSVATTNISRLSGKVKFCPYCGTPNPTDASFCISCGQKQ